MCQTEEIPRIIDDIAMGLDYLGPVLDGHIKENDIVLMVLLNGAQLYEHKDSDCWMYIYLDPHQSFSRQTIQEAMCPTRWIHPRP